MYAYPFYPQRNTSSLDGFWQFAFLGSDSPLDDFVNTKSIVYDDIMQVPGCFDATCKYIGKRGLAVYKRMVNVSAPGRYRLILHAIGLAGKVFCNGKEIFYTKSPWAQHIVELEVSGESFELVIVVDNRIKPGEAATVLFQPNYDFYGYGGIYRTVELEKLPESGHFDRVRVETLDLNGKVRLSGCYSCPGEKIQIAFDNGDFSEATADFSGENFVIETQVPSPELWSPENPALHTVTLKTAGDEICEQFGLRTVEAKNGKIYLNGEEIRLIGYNRHDMHPQFGPAVPDGVWIEDLQLLKDLNCNFIRGSHYQQSQRFLDLCDKLGFLVWEESLGWGNRQSTVGDDEFIKLQIEQTGNMVKASGNHPSIIMWGFLNEVNDCEESGDALVRKLAETVRANDTTRLVTLASMYIKTSLSLDVFDVISFNTYPAWYERENPDDPHPLWRIQEVLDDIVAQLDADGYADKPLVISEIGAGAIYGWHDRMRSFWSEEYQADHLSEVCGYFKTHPRFSGLVFWQFTDGKTYSASAGVLGRPRSFNNKGTLNEYRKPKLAYDIVKQEFATIGSSRRTQ